MPLSIPSGSAGKESTCNAGDLGSILGLGRSPGKGKGYPLQYSGLENAMDCIVHGVTKSRTRLSHFHFHASLSGKIDTPHLQKFSISEWNTCRDWLILPASPSNSQKRWYSPPVSIMASLMAQLVKNLAARRETWVWSLCWEDPLEKGMATHSNILAWRIP